MCCWPGQHTGAVVGIAENIYYISCFAVVSSLYGGSVFSWQDCDVLCLFWKLARGALRVALEFLMLLS